MRILILVVAGLFTIFQFASCENNRREFEKRIISKVWIGDSISDAYHTKKEWTDSVGIFHWTLQSHKSPVLLKFFDEKAILEVPKIEGVFNLADLVHLHGTTIAGREPKFEYNYMIDEHDSTITLVGGFIGDDIKLKFQKGKLEWPIWKSNEFMIFKERE